MAHVAVRTGLRDLPALVDVTSGPDSQPFAGTGDERTRDPTGPRRGREQERGGARRKPEWNARPRQPTPHQAESLRSIAPHTSSSVMEARHQPEISRRHWR